MSDSHDPSNMFSGRRAALQQHYRATRLGLGSPACWTEIGRFLASSYADARQYADECWPGERVIVELIGAANV